MNNIRRTFLVFLLVALIQQLGKAQTFTFQDTVFSVGDYYRTTYLFKLGKKELIPEDSIRLDTVVEFLKRKPNLVIEIGQHRDSRGSQYSCSNLTQQRAKSIADYLINRGVEPDRLRAVGYGEMEPLFTDQTIMSLESEEEREILHSRNRRTEFTILAIDYKSSR